MDGIRSAPSATLPPDIPSRLFTPVLSSFEEVSSHEVLAIISSSPTKTCSVHHILHVAQTISISILSHLSLQTSIRPTSLNLALVLPRLTKSTLDPDMLRSYGPISNLFVSSRKFSNGSSLVGVSLLLSIFFLLCRLLISLFCCP